MHVTQEEKRALVRHHAQLLNNLGMLSYGLTDKEALGVAQQIVTILLDLIHTEEDAAQCAG